MAKNTYKKPIVPSVSEALGVDEEAIQKKQAQRLLLLDINELKSDQDKDREALKKADAEFEKRVIAFEKDDSLREEAERACEDKLRILQHMAKRFHPFSDYGMSMLKKAVDCRKEFEELVGPLLTTITKNNVGLFKTVLPADLYEDIEVGRREAFGAIRTQKGKTYGVGAIVYYSDQLPAYNKQVIRVEWLYVNEKFRGRGIAHFLIGELLSRMVENDLDVVSFEFQAGGEYNSLLGYILGSWQFEFGTGINPVSVIKVGDITGYQKITAAKKGAELLSSIDAAKQKQLIAAVFKKAGYRGYLRGVGGDYIDRDISCFVGSDTSARALLLAHKLPSGVIRAEYVCAKEDDKDMEKLTGMFLENATMTAEDDTLLIIPVDREEMGEFLEEACTGQMGQYLVEGVLEPPSQYFNLDKKTVESM